MSTQLEAIETSPEVPYRDPLDTTGFRCQAEHPDVGKCHRKQGHEREDPWHHSVTAVDSPNRQFWRWCDE